MVDGNNLEYRIYNNGSFAIQSDFIVCEVRAWLYCLLIDNMNSILCLKGNEYQILKDECDIESKRFVGSEQSDPSLNLYFVS